MFYPLSWKHLVGHRSTAEQRLVADTERQRRGRHGVADVVDRIRIGDRRGGTPVAATSLAGTRIGEVSQCNKRSRDRLAVAVPHWRTPPKIWTATRP